MGINPADFGQAIVCNLSKQDFYYIEKVCVLVEKRLKDSDWLAKTVNNLENEYKAKSNTIGSIRFDDELFKAGRGILEFYLKELEKKDE